jgi:hypothetical protein
MQAARTSPHSVLVQKVALAFGRPGWFAFSDAATTAPFLIKAPEPPLQERAQPPPESGAIALRS